MNPRYVVENIPDGYQLEFNATLWNVGVEFIWSNFYECWLETRYRFTIRPNENIAEAYLRESGENLPFDADVFFVKEN